MKEIFKNLKSGIFVGIGFLLTLLVGGIIYASVNNLWTNPEDLEAKTGSPLTSDAWNKILSNQNALSGAINNMPGTHYSIDEVFTGNYWIDNKPIYKKTIYRNTDSTTINNGDGTFMTNVLGTSNYVKEVIDLKWSGIHTNDGRNNGIGGNWSYTNGVASWTLLLYYDISKDSLMYDKAGSASLKNMTITMWYTKVAE